MLKQPFSGMERLSEYMSYHLHRQKVIAGNLANLDTPGYRAKELSFEETLSTKIVDGDMVNDRRIDERMVVSDDETPDIDGNSVSLETQLAKSQANNLRYGVLAEVLRRNIGMLKFASTDGGH